jgi:hypothetical protein
MKPYTIGFLTGFNVAMFFWNVTNYGCTGDAWDLAMVGVSALGVLFGFLSREAA